MCLWQQLELWSGKAEGGQNVWKRAWEGFVMGWGTSGGMFHSGHKGLGLFGERLRKAREDGEDGTVKKIMRENKGLEGWKLKSWKDVKSTPW